MEQEYYYLQVGDYIQYGDEYSDPNFPGMWFEFNIDYIGLKWGFDPDGNLTNNWYPARRIVKLTKEKNYGPDLWGEEFELTPYEIKMWKEKNSK